MYKRKLIITLSLLLICLILLTTAAYAWLTLAQMPEVSGISTHIGANGSLEIALLTDTTYVNPSLIRTSIGSSAVILDAVESNPYWGSLIDLSGDAYGLNSVSVLPARLNVHPGGEGEYVVGTNMLAFPEYSVDGRFTKMFTDSVTATYKESEFIYSTEVQSYGVRGIGTVSELSPQQAALVNARSAVSSYMSASVSATKSVWQSNGAGLLNIYCSHYIDGNNIYSNADVAVIRDTATRMLSAVSYVDLAVRQSLVGYAASLVDDQETFKTIRDTVENTAFPLSLILSSISMELPGNFGDLVETIENDKITLQYVIVACDKLRGTEYTWNIISPLLNEIIDEDAVYLDNIKLSALTSSAKLAEYHELVITPNAGAMADIADYSGNYSAFFTYKEGVNVEVGSTSNVKTPYLEALSKELSSLEAAAGNESALNVPLNQVYGYAVDIAFRCNAESDLLLQIAPFNRVDESSVNELTDGGGSYMQFVSEQLDENGIVTMMDALRVGFLDNKNNLLGIAKLNTSSYYATEDGVAAPLYLYNYSVSTDGSISMGERLDEETSIIHLSKNTPTVITVVVWLDGDHVDNGLSAISAKSMTGVLNLQFASNADLNPADIPIDSRT